jgi:hypothetical protein
LSVSARSYNLWLRTVTDQRRLNLPLFALGAVAAHAVVLAALLPMLITLPGPGTNRRGPLVIDVEVVPAGSSATPAIGSGQTNAGSSASDPVTFAPDTAAAGKPEPELPNPTETTLALPASPAPPETAADPMTTQSTAPLADAGPVNEGAGGEAQSAPTVREETPRRAGRSGSGAPPAIARAEPPDAVTAAVESAAHAAAEQAPAKQPSAAVKPKQIEKSAAKKHAAVSAKPRVSRIAKAKPKHPTSNGDFNTATGWGPIAPPANKSSGLFR